MGVAPRGQDRPLRLHHPGKVRMPQGRRVGAIVLLLSLFALLPLQAAGRSPEGAQAPQTSAWSQALAALHTLVAALLPGQAPKAPGAPRRLPILPSCSSGMDPDGGCST